jgi:hypothetical protein
MYGKQEAIVVLTSEFANYRLFHIKALKMRNAYVQISLYNTLDTLYITTFIV